jgi:hypothetical protein
MTFSLRTLMLLFPALIVSYALAQGCWPGVVSSSGGRPIWSRENLQLRHFQRIAEEILPPASLLPLVPTIDGYFQRKATIPPTLDAAWDAHFGKSLLLDSWGQPYRCVERDNRVQFYSCGQDGITQSAGNDPDDLNSWDEHAAEFYINQFRESELRKKRLESLGFMPLTLAFVVWFWVKLRQPAV